MRWFRFLAVGAMVVWLCRHYSFWAVFGWAYAAASVGLIFVCFTHRLREKREAAIGGLTLMKVQRLKLDGGVDPDAVVHQEGA